MKRIITIISMLVLCFALTANAANNGIKVSWNANTESDLAGYKVYYGTAADKLTTVIDAGKVTSYTLPSSLAEGKTYYVAVSAYDTSGNESIKTDAVSIFLPDTTPPDKPTGLKALLQQLISWLKGIFARG